MHMMMGPMMVKLIARDTAGELVSEWLLEPGVHSVGRAPDNRLVLKDMQVSRKHALFHIEGERCRVTDLASATGIFVGGARVGEASLGDGDVVTIGGLSLEVRMSGDDPGEPVACLESLGSGRSEPLPEEDAVFGRVPNCAIQVLDKSASRRHARIFRIESDYFIEDLRSANGTMLNGIAIDRRRLREGDIIGIGDCRYRFFYGQKPRPATPPPKPGAKGIWVPAAALSSLVLIALAWWRLPKISPSSPTPVEAKPPRIVAAEPLSEVRLAKFFEGVGRLEVAVVSGERRAWVLLSENRSKGLKRGQKCRVESCGAGPFLGTLEAETRPGRPASWKIGIEASFLFDAPAEEIRSGELSGTLREIFDRKGHPPARAAMIAERREKLDWSLEDGKYIIERDGGMLRVYRSGSAVPDVLRPGSMAKVEVLLDVRFDVLAVPKEAIVFSGGATHVYRVDLAEERPGRAVGTARKIAVESGYEDGRFCEFLPSAMDLVDRRTWIITKGQLTISDGDPVEIVIPR